MKRKIALFLAFVMVFTIAPVVYNSLEVEAMVIQGATPTIPVLGNNGIAVGVNMPSLSAFPDMQRREYNLRLMQFLPQVYLVGSVIREDWHLHVARFIVTGLNDFGGNQGGLIPDSNAWDRWTSAVTPAGLILYGLRQADIDIDPQQPPALQNDNGSLSMDGRTNELLTFDSNSDNSMIAFTMRDVNHRNAGIVVVATAIGTPITVQGVSLPINYIAFGNSNINLNVMRLFFGNIPQIAGLPLAIAHHNDFGFRVNGTPTPFHTRTYLRQIDIAEAMPSQLLQGTYRVELELSDGFRWDDRHTNAGAGGVGSVRAVSVLSYVTGFGLSPVHLSTETYYIGGALRGLRTGAFTTASESVFADILRIGRNGLNYPDGGALVIQATESARPGPVSVYVRLQRQTTTGWDTVDSNWVYPAQWNVSEVLFYRYENQNLNNFMLRRGVRSWDTLSTTTTPNTGVYGVVPGSINTTHHRTATVVLTETVRGTLPFTGLRDIEFVFPNGIQVLAVEWETNDGNFIDWTNNTGGREYFYNGILRDVQSRPGSATQGERYSGMSTLIRHDRVSMRPEIVDVGHNTFAEIRLHFYIAVDPNFRSPNNTIAVEARGPGFPNGLTAEIALVPALPTGGGGDDSSSDDNGRDRNPPRTITSGATPGAGGQNQPVSVPGNDGAISLQATQQGERVILGLTSNNEIRNIINNTEGDTVSFNFSDLDVSTALIQHQTLRTFAQAGLSVEIQLPLGTITLSPDAILSAVNQGTGSHIWVTMTEADNLTPAQEAALQDGEQAVSIGIHSGGQGQSNPRAINNFDGTLTVTLPYNGPFPASAWYLAADGTREPRPSTYDAQNNTITFTTSHLSVYIVGFDVAAATATIATPVEPVQQPVQEIALTPTTQTLIRLAIDNMTYTINGIPHVSDVAPFIDPESDRTMIPIRLVSERLGAQVEWNHYTRTATIISGSQVITLPVDEPLPDGMGTPVIINDRTFVPVRFIVEALGADIRWDDTARAVYIYR